jgi:sporulation protein YlmC with PRC-barrel domain
MTITEAHVERLLGRRVHDANGQSIGRLEEFRVEIVDGEHVVTEYHVGGSAVVERIASFVAQLPFFRLIPFARTGYRIPWTDLDLSDPRRPRVRGCREELERMSLDPNDAASS